eukprot:2339420-Pleurochrysis_carterae.AAC.2
MGSQVHAPQWTALAFAVLYAGVVVSLCYLCTCEVLDDDENQKVKHLFASTATVVSLRTGTTGSGPASKAWRGLDVHRLYLLIGRIALPNWTLSPTKLIASQLLLLGSLKERSSPVITGLARGASENDLVLAVLGGGGTL